MHVGIFKDETEVRYITKNTNDKFWEWKYSEVMLLYKN